MLPPFWQDLPKQRTAPTHRGFREANRAERAEREVGARDEVSNGSRDDDLAIAGLSKGPSRDVHADPSDVVVAELDLTGVDRRTNRQPDVAEASIEGEGTSKRPRGRVEGGEDAVPGKLPEAAAEAFDLGARHLVMSIQEPAPSLIAERGCLLGRPDDVGEQHGRKDAIGVLRRLPLPSTRGNTMKRYSSITSCVMSELRRSALPKSKMSPPDCGFSSAIFSAGFPPMMI
jgi:hypothetical protein